MGHSLSTDEVYEIARRHAGEALAQIADHQMNTWATSSTDTPREIMQRQMMNAIEEALVHDRGERRLDASVR